MTFAVPPRPFSRGRGSLDAFVAKLEMPHLQDEAAPGVEVEVRGWVLDTEHTAVVAAWLDIAGTAIPLVLDRARADVARGLLMTDPLGLGVGFNDVITLPNDLATGLHDIRIIGLTRTGRGVFAETGRKVRVPHPYVESRESVTIATCERDFDIRVSDTQTAPYTLGRGAYTVRQEASLRISGQVADSSDLRLTAIPSSGDPVSWSFRAHARGRFDTTFWTGGLNRGLYELRLSTVKAEGDQRHIFQFASCWIDIAGPHYIPPLHLGSLRTRPDACITHFVDAGPRPINSARDRFVAGRPIGIAGWCVDPVAADAALAVYVEVDGKRPVPLAHHLPDPRSDQREPKLPCGFGGIIDTTRLEPGAHAIIVKALAVSGTGWYIIEERTITLGSHVEDAARAPF